MGGGLCRVRARLAPRDCARGRTIKTIKMRVPAFVISFSAYPTKPRLPLSSRCRARGARGRPRGGSREGVTTCSSENRRSGSARGGAEGRALERLKEHRGACGAPGAGATCAVPREDRDALIRTGGMPTQSLARCAPPWRMANKSNREEGLRHARSPDKACGRSLSPPRATVGKVL